MNLLYATPGDFLTLESEANLELWRKLHHNVELMPLERIAGYLRLDPKSSLALVDAIICAADTGIFSISSELRFPIRKALALAGDIRDLPGNCTMYDGRKWNSIPFIIFCNPYDYAIAKTEKHSHAHLLRVDDAMNSILYIEEIVDEFYDRVLQDYENHGILIRFRRGRVQLCPALQRKYLNVDSEYYFSRGDRRGNTRWVTVKRDNEGLRQDVEMFQLLLERNVPEPEMHKFFEEHPAILMQARMGIPISHRPNFSHPDGCTPDFVLSPILGPHEDSVTELLELKRPGDQLLYKRRHHQGLSSKVTHAVDQVRDYERYLRDPLNAAVLLEELGYIPKNPNLAVLIGRNPQHDAEREAFALRQGELNVKIVTYDEILQTQASQIKPAFFDSRINWAEEDTLGLRLPPKRGRP